MRYQYFSLGWYIQYLIQGCSSPLTRAITSPVKARFEKCFPISHKMYQEVEKIMFTDSLIFMYCIITVFALKDKETV